MADHLGVGILGFGHCDLEMELLDHRITDGGFHNLVGWQTLFRSFNRLETRTRLGISRP
jgi:hypothetical protein